MVVAPQCECRPLRQDSNHCGRGKPRSPRFSPSKSRLDHPAWAEWPTAHLTECRALIEAAARRNHSSATPRLVGQTRRPLPHSDHLARRKRPPAARLHNKYYFGYHLGVSGTTPGAADDGLRGGRAIGDVRRRRVRWCAGEADPCRTQHGFVAVAFPSQRFLASAMPSSVAQGDSGSS